MKYLNNAKGLTLTEVLVALSIIGFILAIALPSTGMVFNNRLKSISNQLSLDIRKLSYEARTNTVVKDGDHFKTYKIELLHPTPSYKVHTNGVITEPDLDLNKVEILGKAQKITGNVWELRSIKMLEFDGRGRIQVVLQDDIILTYDTIKKIKLTLKLEGTNQIKYIIPNPLTGSTILTDVEPVPDP